MMSTNAAALLLYYIAKSLEPMAHWAAISRPDTSFHCENTDRRPMYHTVSLFTPTAFTGTHCAYPQRDGQAELTWVAGYIQRQCLHLQTITDSILTGPDVK